MKRWLIFLPVAMLAFFSTPNEAKATGGLAVTAYVVNQIPPLRSDDVYPVCNSLMYEYVQQGWGSGDVAGCLYQHDRVMLHYEGNIVIPEGTPYVYFLVFSDDGGVVTVSDNTFGYWGDRGCGGTVSSAMYLPTETELPIDVWYYENGGGTCISLYWNIGQGWEIVPASAFSAPMPTTTTTTSTTSTTTTTTTTLPETTTTAEATTTSTTYEPTTSSVTSSSVVETSSSVTTTSLPEPSSTSSVPVPPSTVHDFVPETSTTTTTESPRQEPEPVVIPPSATTTTEEPATTTSVQDTVPEETIPVDTTPETTPETTAETLPVIDAEESAPTTDSVTPESDTTVIPDASGSDMSVVEPETDPDTGEYTEEQIAEAIVSIMNNDPSEITTEQVAILVSEGVFEKLSDEQLEMVAETLSSAPEEVKELFEESVDVFSGKVDNYVPLGSTVSVGKRRVLNAVTATLFVMSAPIPVASARKQ